MVRSYLAVLDANANKINGEIFNVGYKNQTVNELASNVKEVIGDDVKIINTVSNDNRSYHVSNEKIKMYWDLKLILQLKMQLKI